MNSFGASLSVYNAFPAKQVLHGGVHSAGADLQTSIKIVMVPEPIALTRISFGEMRHDRGYVPGTSGLDCIVVGYYADCHLFDFDGFGRARGRDRWKCLRRAAGQLQSAQDATHAGFVRRLIRTVIRCGFPSKGLSLILLINNKQVNYGGGGVGIFRLVENT